MSDIYKGYAPTSGYPQLANRGGGVAVEGLGDGGWRGRAVWLEGTAEGGGEETAHHPNEPPPLNSILL
ncbi:MAG: hypothetical protein OT477_14105 [Chloroflexi bacterium]|nr:hypothetical protein [Chloroflexota bacterium]